MKFSSYFSSLAFSLIFSTTAFSAVLPQLVDANTSAHLEKIGTISISSLSGSTDDAIAALQKKAAKLGANKVRIVSLGNSGDSDLWHGNADVYR